MKVGLAWVLAIVFSFAAGVGLSFGQTYAPDAVAPLFNSAAPIVAIAAFTSLGSKQWWGSALLGAIAGPLAMAGYYVTSEFRGFDTNASWVTVWVSAGVVFGLAMGLATWLLRAYVGPGWRAAGAALWPGIAVGEAWHGMTRVSDSTPFNYWLTQAFIGAVTLVVLSAWRVPTWTARLLALILAAGVAGGIYYAYGQL